MLRAMVGDTRYACKPAGLIIGKRKIDIYAKGLMFERDHLVSVKGNKR